MLMILKSSNPEFSHLIGKNPNGLPKTSSCRHGTLFGWYPNGNPQQYAVRFIESSDEISFKEYEDQEFEHLSISKYNCPLIPLRISSDYFLKLDEDKDIISDYEINIYSIKVKNYSLTTLTKYFSNYGIQFDKFEKTERNQKLTIKYNCKLREILDLLELICAFISLDNGEYLESSEHLLAKYFKKLANIDAPYFMRYLFKTNLIRNSKSRFEYIKDLINFSNTHSYNFVPEGNGEARIRFCKPFYNGNIIDIGCGEGRFTTRFAKSCDSYVGIEPNENRRNLTNKKCEEKKLENVSLFENLQQFFESGIQFDSCNVILTEVIEHIKKEELPAFFNEIFKIPNIKNIVITTPNVDFNQYYKIEEDCRRHEEHEWESSYQEVCDLISKLAPLDINGLNTIESIGIGDAVNGIYPTVGLVIKHTEFVALNENN